MYQDRLHMLQGMLVVDAVEYRLHKMTLQGVGDWWTHDILANPPSYCHTTLHVMRLPINLQDWRKVIAYRNDCIVSYYTFFSSSLNSHREGCVEGNSTTAVTLHVN